MFLDGDLIEARFLRRVNRFLAIVELNGRETSVHVANSGRLRELFLPGAQVWLKPASGPARKTDYDLALVMADEVLVSADARLPNALVAEAASEGRLEEIETPASIIRESTFGESRLDLLLQSEGLSLYVEVKSVTLVENGVALFPDSPTIRGAKHLNTLVDVVRAGHRAAVVFLVQRPDAHSFSTYDDADPALGDAFRRAVSRGVDAYAYNCSVSLGEIRLGRRLPIVPFASVADRRCRES